MYIYIQITHIYIYIYIYTGTCTGRDLVVLKLLPFALDE